METFNNTIRGLGTAAVGVAMLLTTACSQISFAPSPGSQSNTSASTEILPDGSVKDTFVFNQNGIKSKVDVLFVDDNSGSMENKQIRLGSALGSFINSLGSIDWQIGITTTDVSDDPNYGLKGSLLPFAGTSSYILTNAVPSFETKFADTVHRSEVGSADERPMRAMMHAFAKRGTDNAGFFRDGADLAVVVLTDEDEASDGAAGSADPANRPEDVVNSFVSSFGNSKTLTVYGILIAPTDTACYNAQSVQGSRYANIVSSLVQLTSGEIGSICDTDYGPALASIGNRVISGIRTATLSQVPESATVTLQITPVDPTLTWSINGRVINFNKPPAKGTKVEVIYKAQ
jgi:hypothetical protein